MSKALMMNFISFVEKYKKNQASSKTPAFMKNPLYLLFIILAFACNTSVQQNDIISDSELTLNFNYYEQQIMELIENNQTTFYIRDENFDLQPVSVDSVQSIFIGRADKASFYNYDKDEEEWVNLYHYGEIRSISFQRASLYLNLIPSLSDDDLIVVVSPKTVKIENEDTIPIYGNQTFTMVINADNGLNSNYVFDKLLSFIENGALSGDLNVYKLNWDNPDEKLSYEDVRYLWQAQLDTLDVNAEKPEKIMAKGKEKLLHYRGLAEGIETLTFDRGDLYKEPQLSNGSMILLGKKFVKVDTDDVEYVLGVSSMFYVGL
jgi:hypothetical protein